MEASAQPPQAAPTQWRTAAPAQCVILDCKLLAPPRRSARLTQGPYAATGLLLPLTPSALTWPSQPNGRPRTAPSHASTILRLEAPSVASAQGGAVPWLSSMKPINPKQSLFVMPVIHAMLFTKLLRGRPRRRRRLQRSRVRSICACVEPPPSRAAAAALPCFAASWIEESEESSPLFLAAFSPSAAAAASRVPLPSSIQE